MLITFSCEVYGNIVMFGDIAQQLLRMMGYDGSKSGVIPADAVPQALERLEAGSKNGKAAGRNDDEQPVGLSQRAFPLIELLKAATKEKCYVMWEVK
jgi:hypothetical protein